MRDLVQDLRFALRMLGKNPGFAAVTIVTLALGIGVNTMIFSVVHTLLLKPLPYLDPQRLVEVTMVSPKQGITGDEMSSPDFLALRDGIKSFESIGAYTDMSLSLTVGGRPERVQSGFASAGLFHTLGIQPVLGTEFTREHEQDGRNLVVILSDRLWKRRFDGDPSIVGKELRINGRMRRVVGVMPPDFRFPEVAEMWVPITHGPTDSRGERWLATVARLAPGVTRKEAEAEVAGLAARIAREHPKTHEDLGMRVREQNWEMRDEIGIVMAMLMGSVVFVLLIACANVANLMLARAATRSREMAVRVALGASRGRLLRQLLTESVVIAVIGAGLGVLLAYWGLDLTLSAVLDEMPFWMKFSIDGTVLAYTTAIAVGSGLLFGLAPALQASRPDLNTALKDSGPSGGAHRNRLLRILVVAEVALSIVLLIGAGLMMRSFHRMASEPLGIEPRGVLMGRVSLPWVRYHDPVLRTQFAADLEQRLKSQPGVEAVSLSNTLPLTRSSWSNTLQIEGKPLEKPGERNHTYVSVATPGWFDVLKGKVVHGRTLGPQDGAGQQPVVMVNQKLAAASWPNQDPIGRRIALASPDDSAIVWRTVVGVFADTKQHRPDQPIRMAVLMPALQESLYTLTIAMRSAGGDPLALADAMRAAVTSLDSDLPVYDVSTMEATIQRTYWEKRLYAMLMATFAALALLLAAVGLYGVMAYAVAQRTREMGVRMALGARPADLLRLVVGQGMRLTLVGLALGVGGAFLMTRMMASLLYGIGPHDPFTFLTVPITLSLTALLATVIPARRAARVEPLTALRYE